MFPNKRKISIAIDGYSSTGKSTLAKTIAKKLNYSYVNTGSMYRAIALYCLENNSVSKDHIQEKEIISSLNNIIVEFRFIDFKKDSEVFLNNKNVENKITSLEVSEVVSLISKIKEVRKFMVKIQQRLGKDNRVVMEGRDIGTVVLPTAEVKFFMIANKKIRAERRFKELKAKGFKITIEKVLENIEARDFEDQTRSQSPLKKPADAIVIDNSDLSPNQQLDIALKVIYKTLNT